jgi:hypothetical protein
MVFQFTLDMLFDLPKVEELHNVVVFYYFEIAALTSEDSNPKAPVLFPIGGYCKAGPSREGQAL